MKNRIIFLVFLAFIFITSAAVGSDEKIAEVMAGFDSIMAEIKSLPGAIDEDLCNGDKASYRTHMTTLAQKIIDANRVIKEMKLYYPIDLWSVYNRISANPVCGIGKQAAAVFGVADVSRISNEEKMGIRENDDLCPCWNIATGREELTGFWKDGACRCTYGIRNLAPNIGINN